MYSYNDMWSLVSGIVEDEGFYLYDLDLPSGKNGTMRIFITDDSGKGVGINLDDCAKISRRLSLKLDVDVEIEESYVLEVSSPGVNRRLRRPEHFLKAVGERVKINTDSSLGKARTVKGSVVSSDDLGVSVQEEDCDAPLMIPFRAIKEARVDFDFKN